MQMRSRVAWTGVGVVAACIVSFFNALIGGLLVAGVAGWAIAVLARAPRPAMVASLLGIPTTSRGSHVASAAGELVLALAILICAIKGADARSASVEKEQRRLIQEQNDVKQHQADLEAADLRAHSAEAVARTTKAVADVKHWMAEQNYYTAKTSLADGQRILARYAPLTPPVAQMVDLGAQLRDAERDLASVEAAKEALTHGPAELANAGSKIREKDYIAADTIFVDLLNHLDVSESTAPYLPMEDIKRMRAVIDRKQRAIAGGIKRQKADIAAAEVYRALCGDKPQRSGWDGEIVGLEAHIKQTANDPDSIDVENCTLPQLTEKHCWVSTCNVRGKNAFNALILLRKTYSFSKLGIEEVM